MYNNFHKIKAVISNHQGFRASFHGMAEYIQGMMNNRIKVKNLVVQAKLYFQPKFENNSVKFENDVLHTVMRVLSKPFENEIKVVNEIKTILISLIKPETSTIAFENKLLQKLNIIFSPKFNENTIEFENNEPKINVALQGRTEENEILFDNNDEDGTHTTVTLASKTDKNDVSFQNSLVNASAWRMMRVGDMKGTVRSYAGLTVGETGRKKIT